MNIPCIPTIPFGRSKVHKSFFGAIYFEDETLEKVIKDIINSLAHYNITNFIIINGHGGNIPIINNVIKQYQESELNFYPFSWWELIKDKFFDKEHSSHASSEEISVLVAIDEGLIRPLLVQDMIPNPSFQGKKFSDVREVTLNGVLGKSSKYSKYTGVQIMSYVVNIICEQLEKEL